MGGGGCQIVQAAGRGRTINPSVHYRGEQTLQIVINHPNLKGEPTRKQKQIASCRPAPTKQIAKVTPERKERSSLGEAVLWRPLVVGHWEAERKPFFFNRINKIVQSGSV